MKVSIAALLDKENENRYIKNYYLEINEILSLDTKWMELEDFTLSKVSQLHKDKLKTH